MKSLHTKLLFAAFLMPFIAIAQQFKPVQVNPFGITKSDTTLQAFIMADMNKDGLPDLLYSDELASTFLVINKGSLGYPDFNGSPLLDFLSDNSGYGVGTPVQFNDRMVDFDKDSDLDYLFNYYGDDPTFPPPYAIKFNQPELIPGANYDFVFFDEIELNSYEIPYLPLFNYERFDYRDINGDGLDDIFGSRFDENNGLQTFVIYKRLSMNFFAPPETNPFGLQGTVGLFGQPCLLDMDGDGDQDLVVLDGFTGNWLYYKNIGTPQMPQFLSAVTNPFNLTSVPDVGATVFAMDINQDGREDLMAANLENFYYYEFNANVSVPAIPLAENVRVFPTLIQDKCFVTVNDHIAISNIVVSDMSGGNTATLSAVQEIDFQSYAPGVYEVTIYLENGSRFSQKVVKAAR